MIETTRKYSIELKPVNSDWVQYTEPNTDKNRVIAAYKVLQGNPMVESMHVVESTYVITSEVVDVYHASVKEDYKLAT